MRIARAADLDYPARRDRRVPLGIIVQKLGRREILVMWHCDRRVGALRYASFRDHIPFMNMPCVEDGLWERDFGTRLIAFWESEMRRSGYGTVMTSTLSTERPQHLYRKPGYEDHGPLLMPGEALEILFVKKLH